MEQSEPVDTIVMNLDEPKEKLTEAEYDELLKKIARRPDFSRFPWPKEVRDKFNLPEPTIPTLREYLKESVTARFQTVYNPSK